MKYRHGCFVAALLLGIVFSAQAQDKSKPAGGALKPDHSDLEYVAGGHERNKLDIYLPKNVEGPFPVVMWIHGGGWARGTKDRAISALAIVEKGYAVVCINYRLSEWYRITDKTIETLRRVDVPDAVLLKLKPLHNKGINDLAKTLEGILTKEEQTSFSDRILKHASEGVTSPAQIHDCKAAVRWVRANAGKYNLDAERIGVWGGSAGGHLVALLGTSGGVKELEGTGGNRKESSRVQAVVDWYGVIDVTRMPGPKPPKTEKDSFVNKFLGGPVAEKKEEAARANPITYLKQGEKYPPFLIMHGDKDDVVPFEQSKLLEAALKKSGVDVTLVTVKGAKHSRTDLGTPENFKQIVEFFDKHLKKK